MGRRHSVRAASVKAAVIRFTKLVFLKQVRVKRDQPHWLTDEGTRIGRPNSEGARASRPDRKESSISPQKGLALSAEESVAVVARPVEPRRETYGQRGPLQPRCRGERLKGKEALPNPAAERRMAGSRWWRREEIAIRERCSE